ncbi:hypothetical protein [Streptomyces sp. NPDC001530]|uniref:hypothetical protein n=1 Tax=Streptomyces sp. NPDC001530 TaxID=3364582 RepID=UPI003684E92E
MDYPHITIDAESADRENNVQVDLTIGGSVPVDEAVLVDVIKNHLRGLSGIATATATQYSVTQQTI